MESATPPNLLIIEDEQGLRDMLSYGLSDYRMTFATNGEEGVKKAEQDHFDLVLTDMMMPGISGVDVVEKLKTISPDTEVIVMTGHPSLETSVACIKAGAYDYLAKPFALEDIGSVFQKALERRRLAVQLRYAQEMSRIKSEFLTAICQSLSDPVRRILQACAEPSSQVDSGLKNVQAQARHLDYLIQRMLEFFDKPAADTALDWQALIRQLRGSKAGVSSRRILVVDDDLACVQLLCLALTQEGFLVETASDGREALKKMALQKPDLLLLDLLLPELTGFEVLEALAKDPSLRHVRVVVMTAKRLSSQETQLLQERVERIVHKGVSDIKAEIMAILKERPIQLKEFPPHAV